MATGKIAAGFVIFRRLHSEIQYLLLQTSYGIKHWTPPKGHVDPGENEWQAAVRETKEEAGILEHDMKVYHDCKKVLIYQVNGKPKTVIYWLAELIDSNTEVKLSNEHQAYEWLGFNKACEYSSYKDMIEMLTEFNNYIEDNCNC